MCIAKETRVSFSGLNQMMYQQKIVFFILCFISTSTVLNFNLFKSFCFVSLKTCLDYIYIYIILQKGSKDLFNLIMLVYFSFQCIFVNSIEMLFFLFGLFAILQFSIKNFTIIFVICILNLFSCIILRQYVTPPYCEIIHIEVIY